MNEGREDHSASGAKRRVYPGLAFGSRATLRLQWPIAAACVGFFAATVYVPLLLPGGSLRALWFHGCVLAGALFLAFARGWNRRALGLVWRPQPSLSYWLYASGWGLLICVVGFLITIEFSRHGSDVFGLCETELPSTNGSILSFVLRASIEEELLFRFFLCGALLGYVSMGANIAINGVVFALVHIVLGGIGPDSVVAGFILAWAFLRSGSIVVPIAMHAAGNGLLFVVYHAELFRSLACKQ